MSLPGYEGTAEFSGEPFGSTVWLLCPRSLPIPAKPLPAAGLEPVPALAQRRSSSRGTRSGARGWSPLTDPGPLAEAHGEQRGTPGDAVGARALLAHSCRNGVQRTPGILPVCFGPSQGKGVPAGQPCARCPHLSLPLGFLPG